MEKTGAVGFYQATVVDTSSGIICLTLLQSLSLMWMKLRRAIRASKDLLVGQPIG